MSPGFLRGQILSVQGTQLRISSMLRHGDSHQDTQATLLGRHGLTEWTQQRDWGLFHGVLRTVRREKTSLIAIILLPGLSRKYSIFSFVMS